MSRSTARAPRRAVRSPRARRVPGWIPIGLVAWGLFAGVAAVAETVETSGFDWVDPARLSIDTDATFVDPRWNRALAARLETCRPFRADDTSGLDGIEDALRSLPFVAEVERPRLVWPDGAAVRLRFERPVACLRRGGVFLCVADSGRVLPGGWMAPPTLDGLPLPVLGRIGSDEPDAIGGRMLPRAGLEHALALARSMAEHLSVDERLALGPVVIDGENAAVGRVDDPGAVLFLKGRRVVTWGRTPDIDAPGSLSTAEKWRSVAEADALFRSGELPWRAVDVRWDQYAVGLREDQPPPEPLAWRTGIERVRDEAVTVNGDVNGNGDVNVNGHAGAGFDARGDWEADVDRLGGGVNRDTRPALGRVR